MIRRIEMKKIKRQATNPPSGQRRGELERSARSKLAHDLKLEEVVAEVREGDGVDPRNEAKQKLHGLRIGRQGQERGAHRRDRFAVQVKEAIDSALRLAAEPLLNALTVREVVPQGGTLLVVTEPRNPALPLDISAAMKALKRAATMLTREVAREITRKETPILSFIVLPTGAERLDP
jgi:hypothetical protein